MKLKAGLPWKFTLSISALIVLTSITLGWFFHLYGVELIKNGLIDRGRSLARNLAYNSEYGVLIANRSVLNQLVEGVIREEDVLYAMVRNESGEVLAEAQSAELKKLPPEGVERSLLRTVPWTDPLTQAYQIKWGHEVFYEVVYPVRTQQVRREREEIGLALDTTLGRTDQSGSDRTIGLATVGMSLSLQQVNATITDIYRTIALLTAFVILAGIGVTVFLVKIIAGPVKELAEAARRIAAGEWKSHVAIKSRDEIGDLAESFNRMAQSVQQREDELRSHADQVDQLNCQLVLQQQDLRDINAQLEAASRHKSQFLANMSHELRTPLNAIIGFSGILLNEAKQVISEEERKEFLDNIITSGRHLLGLINDVLDLAKIEAGKVSLNPESFVVGEVLSEVCHTLEPLSQAKNITVEMRVDPELSAASADVLRFKQILYNLLSNAIKFTPQAGSVQVRALKMEKGVEFSVIDTGIGIRPENRERIFKEFEQVEMTAERRYDGTGLGLTLAKKLVELHGGRMWLETEPGKGSTFAFLLPLTP